MAGAFDWVCAQLQGATSLSELEVRGTVRLALKQAGLEARSVTPDEMAVVLRRVMPGELAQRGVGGAPTLCEGLAARVAAEARGDDGRAASSVEAVFRRLGGGAAR